MTDHTTGPDNDPIDAFSSSSTEPESTDSASTESVDSTSGSVTDAPVGASDAGAGGASARNGGNVNQQRGGEDPDDLHGDTPSDGEGDSNNGHTSDHDATSHLGPDSTAHFKDLSNPELTDEEVLAALELDADEPTLGGELSSTLEALEWVTKERDEYLDMARRVQADFENFKRRTDQQKIDVTARAAEGIVSELLPVLDACKAAMVSGHTDVEPIAQSLLATLQKQGLVVIDEEGVVFDPNQHDAVLSEPGDDDQQDQLVAEVMRDGFLWKGRVLRPAMVKVKG